MGERVNLPVKSHTHKFTGDSQHPSGVSTPYSICSPYSLTSTANTMFNSWYLNEYGEQRVRRTNPTIFKRSVLVGFSLLLNEIPYFFSGAPPPNPLSHRVRRTKPTFPNEGISPSTANTEYGEQLLYNLPWSSCFCMAPVFTLITGRRRASQEGVFYDGFSLPRTHSAT